MPLDTPIPPPQTFDPDATVPPRVDPAGVTRTVTHVGTGTQNAPLFGTTPGTGRLFGDYELLAEIARGGMGVVFRARQVSLNREVAVKMILTGQLAGSADVQRFRAEAEAAANLDHPNVLPIYEVGDHAGQQYFSMKFVAGGTLADQLRSEPGPTVPGRIEQFTKVCRAVHFAHQRGILHRDLKPGNVLVDADGTPYVTDFGLAKKVEGDSNLTQSGAIVGTPSYMPPEQARGEKHLTTSADVYSLGAILYEVLTGRPPFKAGTVIDTVLQVLEKEPEHPRKRNPAVDPELAVIALKCLEKDPARRYASAAALVDDLDRWQRGEPVSISRATQLERGAKWVRRHKGLSTAAAAVVAALTVGTAVATWQAVRASGEARRAEQQAGVAREQTLFAREQAEAAGVQKRAAEAAAGHLAVEKREALDTLYATRINLARREWLHGLSYTARDFLAQAPQERRGWEYDFLRGLFAPERQVLRTGLPPLFVAGSADGTLVASSSSHEPNLHMWDALTGLELGNVPDVSQPTLLRFAPKSRKLACVVKPAVRLIDAETRRTLWTSGEFDSPVVALNWSTDEQFLHTVTLDGRYRRLDASTGAIGPPTSFQVKLDPQTPHLLTLGLAPVISADARHLAAVNDEDDRVEVWDLADGKLAFSSKDHDKMVGQFAFSPDGKLLATPGGDGTVVVREVASGRLVHRLRGHKSWVWSAAFSPDGRYLASASKDTTVRLWDAATGETVQVFRGHLSEARGLTFGGSVLLSYGPDATIRVWDAADPVIYSAHASDHARQKGLPVRGRSGDADGFVLVHHASLTADIAFSPDGRRLATSARGDDKAPYQVIVRDLLTRQETCRIATPPATERHLAFSADGKLLAVLLQAQSDKESATELRVYDGTTGRLAWNAPGPKAKRSAVGIHPGTGQFEAQYQLGDAEATIVRHDLATGHVADRVKLTSPFIKPLIRAGGRLFGTVGGPKPGEIQVCEFDPVGGEAVRSWATGYPSLTACAGSDRLLATAHGNGTGPADIALWDATTGVLVRKLEGSVGFILGLVFSPDGGRLLSCGNDFAARVWDTASGRELLTLSGHGDVVMRAAWSRDGGRIATTCLDGTVRVWSAEGGGVVPEVDTWQLLSPTPGMVPDKGQFLAVQNGEWRLEAGGLLGTLRDLPNRGFAIAHTILPTIDLPRTADVQCRVEVSHPMLIGVSLSNPTQGLGYTPFVSTAKRPFDPGARLLVWSTRSKQSVSLLGIARSFPLETNRPYRFRVLRQEGRLRLFVDGQELVDEKVPDIDLPQLQLQGSWSNAGDEIRFSHLEVRAPAEAVRERQVRARLDLLFAEELLPDPVRARLADDQTLTDPDRQTLLAALDKLSPDAAALRKSARALATKEGASPTELERSRRQVRAVLDLEGAKVDHPTAGTVGDLGLLALVEYRLKNADAAGDAFGPVLEFVRRHQGYNSLDELALAGLIEHARGHADAARLYLQRLRDLDRPEAKWGEAGRPLIAEAMQLADRLLTVDPAREAVREAYLRTENAGWIRKQVDQYFEGRTSDCRAVDQRDERPGPYDVDLSLPVLKARRAFQFQELEPDKTRLMHDDWDVRVTGDRARLSLTTIAVISGTWTGRWATTSELKLLGGKWLITNTRSHQTHETAGDQFVALDAAHWAKKDRAVAEATSDAARLAALTNGRRYREAFELGRKVVADPKATADDWFNFGKSALTVGETSEAVRAAKKAHELMPEQVPLPPWAK